MVLCPPPAGGKTQKSDCNMTDNSAMKKILFTLTACVLASSPLFAQEEKGGKGAEGGKSGPAGYGSAQWGATVSSARENVAGKITFVDEKRIIITREGDIEYRYGFFFRDPSLVENQASREDNKTPAKGGKAGEGAGADAREEAKLYYVLVRFPYLHMEDVKKKIVDKYGEPTGENIKNNQGAMIWDFANTSIIMWVDDYERNPFCRKITYIGKELAKEVNDYQKRVFTGRELEIIRNLNP